MRVLIAGAAGDIGRTGARNLALAGRLRSDGPGGGDGARRRLHGHLRHLGQHSRMVGSRAGPGRAIGYEPVDDAEQYAADIPVRDEDAAEGARVGGPFATLPEPPSPLG